MSKFNIENTLPIVAADNAPLMKGIQGNIIAAHGRNHAVHLFIHFNPDQASAARDWIQRFSKNSVTSAYDQEQQRIAYRAQRDSDSLFAGLSISTWGYNYLGFSDPLKQPFDSAFIAGMKNRREALSDPKVTDWEQGFQGELHALVILASDSLGKLEDAVQELEKELSRFASIPVKQDGQVLRQEFPGTSGSVSQVTNHFGYADGISQPLFLKRQMEAAGSTEKWDPFASLSLVLSEDPNSASESAFGSLMAYRKLQMNPVGFADDVEKAADALTGSTSQDNQDLVGAYAVGRFKNGTPVINSSESLPATNPAENDFLYHDNDFSGSKCPFHSHTRKSNPRYDTTAIPNDAATISRELERGHRIARRAISYGAKGETKDVGLLFICYQAQLTNQFEFIQAGWANTNNFVKQVVGQDTVIGQGNQIPKEGQNWPTTYGEDGSLKRYNFSKWVTMMGGEYFYTPSMDFIQNIAAGE